jgi:hypothetical protein
VWAWCCWALVCVCRCAEFHALKFYVGTLDEWSSSVL